MLITLGTPHGRWPDLATQLWQGTADDVELADPAFSHWHDHAPELAALDDPHAAIPSAPQLEAASVEQAQALISDNAGKCWGGVDPRACWSARHWAELNPAVRFLAFYEPPSLALAHALQTIDEANPQLLLQRWQAGAQQLLQLLHRYRNRVLLVDMREAQTHPQRLRELCTEHFGIHFAATPSVAAPAAPDAVITALVAAQVKASKSLQALCTELEVCTTPLAQIADAADDNLTALAHYQQLRQRQAALLEQATQAEQVEQENELLLQQLNQVHSTQQAQREQQQQEAELLQLQLHQVQEELEQQYLENQQHQPPAQNPAGEAAQPPPLQALQCASVVMGQAEDNPPFYHINFTLAAAVCNQRPLGTLHLRLVEHRGDAGLAFFAHAGAAPLQLWEPSGEEDGQAYMLLFPKHKRSGAVFARMGASDWLLVNDVLALMHVQLANAGPEHWRWRLVHQRLCEQLDALPAQLRHDAPQLRELPASPGQQVLGLEVGALSYGQRFCSKVKVQLQFSGASIAAAGLPATLTLVTPTQPSELPLLTQWPRGEQGELLAQWPLQFGKTLPKAQRNAQWQALSAQDRQLLRALIHALPTLLAASGQAGLPARCIQQMLQEIDKSTQPRRRVPLFTTAKAG